MMKTGCGLLRRIVKSGKFRLRMQYCIRTNTATFAVSFPLKMWLLCAFCLRCCTRFFQGLTKTEILRPLMTRTKRLNAGKAFGIQNNFPKSQSEAILKRSGKNFGFSTRKDRFIRCRRQKSVQNTVRLN